MPAGCKPSGPFLPTSTVAVSPVSPPSSPGQLSPRGASAIRTRSGRVSRSTAPSPRHLRPSESAALSTCRGGSRRRSTSVAISGSSLPAALAHRTPPAGVPARPGAGAVFVCDILALPLLLPARAPLLARLGVLACEAVFSGPAVHCRLAAAPSPSPCVPLCSFPCL